MRILIIAGSGGVGRWVARLAAEAGHDVVALVRAGTRYEPPAGVAVRVGSALDPAELRAALAGRDVAISCLGPQRTHPWNPWSPLRPPARVAELAARALVEAAAGSGVRRFAAISAAGVGDSAPLVNRPMRALIRRSTIGEMYADLGAMEEVLRGSGLDWLAARPVTLISRRPTGRARLLERYRAHSVIGRGDVAAWLLAAAVDPAPVAERTPMIGWW